MWIADCRKHILTYKKINFCNGASATSLSHLSLSGLDLICQFDFLAHSIIKLPQLLWGVELFAASISTIDLTPFSLCTEASATLVSHWYSYRFNLYHWYDFLVDQHLSQCGLWILGFILYPTKLSFLLPPFATPISHWYSYGFNPSRWSNFFTDQQLTLQIVDCGLHLNFS